MNKHHDRLDVAIDAVAVRLTEVTDDNGLAQRIVNALPERTGWSLGWLVPRLAMLALGSVAVTVVLRTFDDRSTTVLRTEKPSTPTVAHSTIVEPPSNDRRTIVEPPLIVRRTIVEPPPNDRRTINLPDHERSLPSLGAVAVLTLDSLAPVSLPEDAPLTLKPLEIADLPLTADIFSPR